MPRGPVQICRVKILVLVRGILYGLEYRVISIDESFLTRFQLINRPMFLTRSIFSVFYLDMDGKMLVQLEVKKIKR